MDHVAVVCDWGPGTALRMSGHFVLLVTGQIPRHLHGHNPLQGHQPRLFFPESKPISGTVFTRKQTGRAVMKMQTNSDNELVRVGMNRMQFQHKQLEVPPKCII